MKITDYLSDEQITETMNEVIEQSTMLTYSQYKAKVLEAYADEDEELTEETIQGMYSYYTSSFAPSSAKHEIYKDVEFETV